jgi:hypothetical protein
MLQIEEDVKNIEKIYYDIFETDEEVIAQVVLF